MEKKSGNSSEKGLEKKGGNHVWDDMQFSAKIPLRRSKGPFLLFFRRKKLGKVKGKFKKTIREIW